MGAMDELINSSVVTELRSILMSAEPNIELPTLERSRDLLGGQRLRQRVDVVRDALLEDLPAGYLAVEKVMLDSLDDPRFTGWMVWPATEVVTGRALQSASLADFDAALAILSRLTSRLTGEFAIRDLIAARPERAIATMQTWTNHDDENVRRLATEALALTCRGPKEFLGLWPIQQQRRGSWMPPIKIPPNTFGVPRRTISTI